MNCDQCGNHILATTQIAWHGKNYHADCIGEAVAQFRAEQEPVVEISDDDFEEQFDNEFDEMEAQDDIDEYEDVVARLEAQEPIVPEVLPPDHRREVHINDVVATASQAFVAERMQSNGTLIAGLKGSRYVEYPELKNLPLPESTNTFKPIAFYDFVTKLLHGLWDRRMNVVNSQYVVSQDGMKLFGLVELENEFNGVRFAVGLRTSNDKSTKLALACGYRVMCCSNGMLSGDFLPLAVKHSANLELDDALALGIDRIRRRFGDLETSIQAKQSRLLTDNTAKEFIYNAFTTGKFPVSLFRTVHSEYFDKPSYDEFKPRTVFSLENAFTTSFKKLQPMQQFEQTARFSRFITELN